MKPGDQIMCLKNFMCIVTDKREFTAGKIYVVKNVVGEYVYVEQDDQGMTDNGWLIRNFQLVQ